MYPVWFLTVSFLLLVAVLGVSVYFILRLYSDFRSWQGGAPYVGVPLKVAREALKLACVSSEDTLYDLGCGDGRVLLLALEEFQVARAVGYEIGIWPYLKARLKSIGQASKMEVHKKDLFRADLHKATVVFLYLYPGLLDWLKNKIKSEVADNARVIVVTWGFEQPFGKPLKQEIIPGRFKPFKVFVFSKFPTNKATP